MAELAADLASRHGESAGIDALGYPTSWCHTREELERIVAHLNQKGPPT